MRLLKTAQEVLKDTGSVKDTFKHSCPFTHILTNDKKKHDCPEQSYEC